MTEIRTFIRGGTVIDPKHGTQARLGVIIEDGRVEALTRDDDIQADTVIDAEGKIVAPGFVDLHMHEDPLDDDGRLAVSIFGCMLRMGVTTAVGGNCGINVHDPAEYLDIIDRDGAPVNVAMYAGHAYAREAAGAADKYKSISGEQIRDVRRRLAGSLDAGCVGISYGIRYIPGIDERELSDTAAECAGRGKLIAAHIRDDAAGVFKAADEFISVGLKHDLDTEISHIGSMAGFGQMERFLETIDALRANGMRIDCDCYPYSAFSTRIGTATYDDGFLDRYDGGYGAIEICEGKYRGRRCDEAIFRELRETAPETLTVAHVMSQSDIDAALLHPSVIIASDGLLDAGQGHPRAAGAFPRFLHEYAAGGRISLYDAIAKITSMPAAKAGLTRKGGLGRGDDADIVIFDPAAIRDTATFADPATAPEGISHVLIGGRIAVSCGRTENDRLGRSVRG